MNIAKTGFWSGNDTAEYHKFDIGLANALVELFKNCTVLDLGCGQGRYVQKLNDCECSIMATGMDGSPDSFIGDNCFTKDLTIPFVYKDFGKISDWVMSLEVGEHIPKEYTQTFIKNIKNNSTKGIVISWAIPGQGGDGHVNELPNEEVIKMFSEYAYDAKTSQHLRNSADLWWFKNTIMVFRKV
jgi:cyclopropane fatty-acyl-phospholipid synthase-like methyltransferase